MALRCALGAARRSMSRRACDASPAPPCPPCEPPAAPPCRAPAPPRPRAVRVTCCPPPQGAAPPCDPPPCPPALDCRSYTSSVNRATSCSTTGPACGTELDRVARRLREAERRRREQYEREAAARRPCAARLPPPAPPALGPARTRQRATDGRDYALPCGLAPPPPCGPARRAPPPHTVELEDDGRCRVRDAARLDPCAHRPRTIVQISRSTQRSADKAEPPAAGFNAPARGPNASAREPTEGADAPTGEAHESKHRADKCPSARNFTARIIESLSLKRNATGEGATRDRKPCADDCDGSGARRAGDDGWCGMAPPPAVPPPCSEPAPADRFKRRGPTRCSAPPTPPPVAPTPPRRSLHTRAAPANPPMQSSVEQAKADAEKLQRMLEERSVYPEAGRGRVVRRAAGGDEPAGGALDVSVPPGTGRVRVRVTLVGADACAPRCPPAACAPAAASTGADAVVLAEKCSPWTSTIKTLLGCRKTDEVKMTKDATAPPQYDGDKMPTPKDAGGRPAAPAAAGRTAPPACPPCAPSAPPRSPHSPCARPAPPRSPCAPPGPPRSPCAPPDSKKPPSPCDKPSPPKQPDSTPSPCDRPSKTTRFVAKTDASLHPIF